MDNIQEKIKYIKESIAYQDRCARDKFEKKPNSAKKHQISVDMLNAILKDYESEAFIEQTIDSSSNDNGIQNDEDFFNVSFSEISELPKTLLDTLNLSPADELESQVISLLRIAKRPLSIKELIIGLYKKYKVEIEDRNKFASKLYRMSSSETIKSTEGKRGYYELPY